MAYNVPSLSSVVIVFLCSFPSSFVSFIQCKTAFFFSNIPTEVPLLVLVSSEECFFGGIWGGGILWGEGVWEMVMVSSSVSLGVDENRGRGKVWLIAEDKREQMNESLEKERKMRQTDR